MIEITPSCSIPDEDISFEFTHASGPGGQNVNKVATAVRLKFDLNNCQALSDPAKSRLYKLAGKRISKAGILSITSRRFRRQDKNRQEALNKFVDLLQTALRPQKSYIKTSVPLRSRLNRLDEKKHRSRKKQLRRPPESNDS